MLRTVNERLYRNFPDIMMVAEESTSWPGVSHPTSHGGLGFGFKWNMGWMNDTLHYMARDPIHRKFHHNEMTFGLLYAFSENFVLPLSHDEVVHGKGTLLTRMPGDSWQQFANLRAYLGLMWNYPGKKLLFMGGEFGQRKEWNHDQSLDWHLLDDPAHAGLKNLVRDLNALYCNTPALHALDCEAAGFEWIAADDHGNSVFAFLRKGADGAPPMVVVSNLTPTLHDHYCIGVPQAGHYHARLNTDSHSYGGSNAGNAGGVEAEAKPLNGHPWSIGITLPPLATVVLQVGG
jgi:1,4-alpha-glucan branching enzyme